MNFTEYDTIPRFEMQDEAARKRLYATFPIAAWLCGLTAVLFFIGYRNTQQWPTDID